MVLFDLHFKNLPWLLYREWVKRSKNGKRKLLGVYCKTGNRWWLGLEKVVAVALGGQRWI